MSVYLGNIKIGEVYLGNNKIIEAYLGNTKVYEAKSAETYTFYDWIQADSTTGVPNIDTGLAPNLSSLWIFEGKFARTSSLPSNYASTWIFSKTNSAGYISNYSLGRIGKSSTLLSFNYNSRANSETYCGKPSTTISTGDWHTFKLQASSGISYGGELILDGVVTTYDYGSKPVSSTSTLKILPANTTSNVPYPCKFAEFKITHDGNLVRDFIPAKRDSDNIVGLYDIVNNIFYEPQSGCTLICGNGF